MYLVMDLTLDLGSVCPVTRQMCDVVTKLKVLLSPDSVNKVSGLFLISHTGETEISGSPGV